jgi:hypothetical protein
MCDSRTSILSMQIASTDVLQALFRFFAPFRLMKDASRGSFEERMAAYRHNRRMRGQLPACMLRWAASCSVAVLLTTYFESLGDASAAAPSVFIWLAAACATFIACGVCVMFITAYVYFYLAHNDF